MSHQNKKPYLTGDDTKETSSYRRVLGREIGSLEHPYFSTSVRKFDVKHGKAAAMPKFAALMKKNEWRADSSLAACKRGTKEKVITCCGLVANNAVQPKAGGKAAMRNNDDATSAEDAFGEASNVISPETTQEKAKRQNAHGKNVDQQMGQAQTRTMTGRSSEAAISSPHWMQKRRSKLLKNARWPKRGLKWQAVFGFDLPLSATGLSKPSHCFPPYPTRPFEATAAIPCVSWLTCRIVDPR